MATDEAKGAATEPLKTNQGQPDAGAGTEEAIHPDLKGATFEDGEEPVEDVEPKAADESGQADETKKAIDSETKPDDAKKNEREIDQEKVDKKIASAIVKKKEAELRADAAEKKAADAEAEIARLKGEDDVVVPDMPDILDDDYDQKLVERDKAIEKQALLKAEKDAAERKKTDSDAEVEAATQAKNQAGTEKMYKDAGDMGMSAEDFKEAEKKVSMFLPPYRDLGQALLEREDIAQVVKYLSEAPTQLEKISTMTPMAAMLFIERTIAPEAAKLKPGSTNAPEPPDIPEGGGAGEQKDAFLDGVSFE